MKKRLGLAAALAAAVLGFSMSRLSAPTLAGGGCTKYDVTGAWSATQDNGYYFNLYLTQDGAVAQGNYTGLVGTYILDDSSVEKGNYKTARTGLGGTVSGNQIDFNTGHLYKLDSTYQATGVYSTAGHYTGTIQDYQIINGRVEDTDNPGHFATWTAQGGPACAG